MSSLTKTSILALVTIFGASSASEARSRACLTPRMAEALSNLEDAIGKVHIISTCRPGAKIKGTNRVSRHASGNAVDFKVKNKKRALKWLIANHRGGIMTYRKMSHIHIDVGPRFVKLGAR